MYIIEGGHWTFGRQLSVLTNIWFCFSILTIIGALITYIVNIRGRLGYLFIENAALLNKMNEGLVVIDESARSLKFANIPAVQMIKYHSATEKADESDI